MVSLVWTYTILIEAYICKKYFNAGFFVKLISYGIASLFIYFLLQDKIKTELNSLWMNERLFLIIFILSFIFLSTLGNYLYYYSYNKSKNRSHIVIPITIILPSILAIIGTALILKEKIKTISVVGFMFIVIGSYILIVNNK